MSSLQGKKLLVLGGPALAGEIVKTAQKLGIYVIVTDWYTEDRSPAKKIADKALMISTADVDSLVNLVLQEEIDGVLTGFTDSTLKYYQQVCEKTNLPCYITAEQVDISTNKIMFKQACRHYGIPVVKDLQMNGSGNHIDYSKIDYPVLVKPADNSGARGISICKNKAELLAAQAQALSFSESGSVVVERYMSNKEATIFYIIDDGEPILTGMADRHMGGYQEGEIPLPVAYSFPSKFLGRYQKYLDDKVCSMFKDLGMKNGMLFIQTFIENQDCIFYEIGFRLTGSLEYKILEKVSGINPMEMMIRFSLTGKMSEENLSEMVNPKFNVPACNITFLVEPGEIGEIQGIDEVLCIPEVIDVFPSYQAGDIIPSSAKGTLQQIALRVFAVAENIDRLAAVMDQVHEKIKVFSTAGDNMLLQHFNTKELLEKNEYSIVI